MCSKATTILAAFVAATALADDVSIEKQRELEAMKNRTVLESRQMITNAAGERFLVEHWRNPGEGQREWITNAVRKITGVAQSTTWSRELERLNAEIEKWLNQSASYSNMLAVVRGQLAAAQAKITDEIADLNAKIVKYETKRDELVKKYPLFEKVIKDIYNNLITDAQNRIKILQALAEGN